MFHLKLLPEYTHISGFLKPGHHRDQHFTDLCWRFGDVKWQILCKHLFTWDQTTQIHGRRLSSIGSGTSGAKNVSLNVFLRTLVRSSRTALNVHTMASPVWSSLSCVTPRSRRNVAQFQTWHGDGRRGKSPRGRKVKTRINRTVCALKKILSMIVIWRVLGWAVIMITAAAALGQQVYSVHWRKKENKGNKQKYKHYNKIVPICSISDLFFCLNE